MQIDASLAFAEKLLAVNPAYARANPLVPDRIKKIKGQNRNYLAHEYFNRDWLPMSFARMAEWLAPAKLSYACSRPLPRPYRCRKRLINPIFTASQKYVKDFSKRRI